MATKKPAVQKNVVTKTPDSSADTIAVLRNALIAKVSGAGTASAGLPG
ncbi:MAG: hypothetical protein RugAbin2_02424 [Rugosibacter sp.]|nr:hypothetical protein [Rugosibacter sp.]